ncbi:hypothetical protein C2E23DRAFT_801641 [Lenzites betulinus]|nr:hypothetical protein C2E23DRAFT_801641 [Lenzites betulinus]
MLSSRPIAFNSDVDVAVQPNLNAKTPGRKTLKNRAALQENALYSGAKTVLSKKNGLQTPFRPGTAHGKKPLVSMSVTRPLQDKTPFPNRVALAGAFGASKTPATKGFKLSKLALLVPEPEQPELLSPDAAPLLRPSSTRKSLRSRLSGTFKTPMTRGDHWNVSPGDMEMELAAGPTDQVREDVAQTDPEDDEIEYMPPTAIEPPFEPPFELPDYKNMGRQLFTLGHAPLVDDALDMYYSAPIEQQLDIHEISSACGPKIGSARFDELELSDLDDDTPFRRATGKPTPVTTAGKVGALARGATARAAPTLLPARAQAAPKVGTAAAQTRTISRTTGSTNSTAAVGPAPTRTSVLRAAKAAAASNSATTPHPIRPTTSAGARPTLTAIPRRPATSAAMAAPLVRSATIGAFSSSKTSSGAPPVAPRTRPAINGAAGGRARSATVSAPSSKPKMLNGTGVGKPVINEDPLAAMLEKGLSGGLDDDFAFDV